MAVQIPYVRWFEVAYGVAEQVSPLIRRVTAHNPGPFTYTGTGAYIVGKGEVAVIDPGPRLDAHLDALMRALDGERVTHILVTHTHLDHSPLAHPLAERTGARIWAAQPPAPSHTAEVATEEGLDEMFRPDVILEGGERIEGKGWTFEALATPGHASNHMAFALLEENALFSGDHVMGWSTTVVSPPDGDMGAYYASLDAVRARGFSTLWPTHGPPVTDPEPFLDAYREHRLDRERQILDRLAAGDRTIAEMVPTIYAAVDRRLWPAASHSMLAHLIDMTRRGIVATEAGPPAIDSRYLLRA
ncbi:MAG: MBL fold metallo-hydrolase [Proteobacteria bacterium]|nr:MBL fold metallo-hydrolase [Pseudomonadota bacterium]